MKEVAIVGVGLSTFGVYPKRSVREMGEVAIWNALQHANVNRRIYRSLIVAQSAGTLRWGAVSMGRYCWIRSVLTKYR